MRPLALALTLGLSTAGCLAHERPPVDAGTDASTVTGTRCDVRCPAATLLGATTPYPNLSGTAPLLGVVATDDAVFVLTLVPADPAPTELEMIPTIYRFDRGTGAPRSLPPPAVVRTHPPLEGGSLRLIGNELHAVVLETSLNTFRPRDARVAEVVWSIDGSLLEEHDSMATAPFLLVPIENPPGGTACGRGDRDLALFGDHAIVHAFTLDATSGAAPSLIDLVSLTDDGPLLPLSASLLDDGTIVVAGGGGTRAPFLAHGAVEDAPLAAGAVVGERYDPPPQIVAESPGFAVVRFASEPADLAASTIRVQHRAPDDTLVRELAIPTTNGVGPRDMSAFSAASGAGLVWTETPVGFPGAADLRGVAPGITDGCTTATANVVARFDVAPMSMRAIADPAQDGAILVVIAAPTPPPDYDVQLSMYRVDPCSVER